MCDDSFKTMVYSLIQSGLNIMVLHVVSRPKYVCLPTSDGSSKSVSKGKITLLSDYLLQRINNTMFDNLFTDQYKFDYSESSGNEDDDMLDPNMMINVVDDDEKIIPHVPEFRDVFRSSFVVSNDWALSHRCMPRESNLEVRQTFSSKNELVNRVK